MRLAVLRVVMYLENLENTQEVSYVAFIPLFYILQTVRGFRCTGYLGKKINRIQYIWWRGTGLIGYPIFRKDIPNYRVEIC